MYLVLGGEDVWREETYSFCRDSGEYIIPYHNVPSLSFHEKLLLFYIFSANTFRGSLVAATVQTAVFFTRSRVSQRIVKKRRSVLTIGGGEDQKD